MKYDEVIAYDDVLLVPQFSTINSRKEINITTNISGILSVPIISAPMDTITDGLMAEALYMLGCGAFIHRYNTIEKQRAELKKATSFSYKQGFVGCAIGCSGDFFERTAEMIRNGATHICIDVDCIMVVLENDRQ